MSSFTSWGSFIDNVVIPYITVLPAILVGWVIGGKIAKAPWYRKWRGR